MMADAAALWGIEIAPGVRLRGELYGAGRPVLLLHGGGQSRGSWRGTAEALAARGYQAVTLDLRGHGESDWVPGCYQLDDFARDVRIAAAAFSEPPVLVGASLGGMSALLACGEAPFLDCAALVLVDIAPRIDPEGGRAVHGFMSGTAGGFDTLGQAADAVAEYLPHRERPSDHSGLMRNLRQAKDGRFYWRWDPDFVTPREGWDMEDVRRRLEMAVMALAAPVLMVHGGQSEIVRPQAVAELSALRADIETVEIAQARHMVAGDDNDAFRETLLEFLTRKAPVRR